MNNNQNKKPEITPKHMRITYGDRALVVRNEKKKNADKAENKTENAKESTDKPKDKCKCSLSGLLLKAFCGVFKFIYSCFKTIIRAIIWPFQNCNWRE